MGVPDQRLRRRVRGNAEVQVRDHTDPVRREALLQHALQPDHRPRPGDWKGGVDTQPGGRPLPTVLRIPRLTRRRRLAGRATRSRPTVCEPHSVRYPRCTVSRRRRGRGNALPRIGKSWLRRPDGRRRTRRSRRIPSDLAANRPWIRLRRRLSHRSQSASSGRARHRSRIQRPIRRPDLSFDPIPRSADHRGGIPGRPALRPSPVQPTRGRPCLPIRLATSCSFRWGARRPISTAASGLATTRLANNVVATMPIPSGRACGLPASVVPCGESIDSTRTSWERSRSFGMMRGCLAAPYAGPCTLPFGACWVCWAPVPL